MVRVEKILAVWGCVGTKPSSAFEINFVIIMYTSDINAPTPLTGSLKS